MGVAAATNVVLYYLEQQPVASPLGHIQSVQRCTRPVTPIPGTPAWLSGVMSVSGELLSLLDLSAFLSLPSQRLEKPTVMLVCQLSHQRYGVLVSRCVGRFSACSVEQQTTRITPCLRPYVTEMVNVNDIICPFFDLIALCADLGVAESQPA